MEWRGKKDKTHQLYIKYCKFTYASVMWQNNACVLRFWCFYCRASEFDKLQNEAHKALVCHISHGHIQPPQGCIYVTSCQLDIIQRLQYIWLVTVNGTSVAATCGCFTNIINRLIITTWRGWLWYEIPHVSWEKICQHRYLYPLTIRQHSRTTWLEEAAILICLNGIYAKPVTCSKGLRYHLL